MNIPLFTKLHEDAVISTASFEKIKKYQAEKLFSVHWEMKIMLYLGVILLTGGLGILVYKNIDTIGHQFVLLFIGLICAGGFFYCFKKKLPFSFKKVAAPNNIFDYVLLLSCISFVIFVGYFQYQYHVFGQRYGLATFIPMLVLFASAYYFDHLGVLSLAITNLAAWVGISVTPLQLIQANDFNDIVIVITGVLLGAFLIVLSLITEHQKLKPHFAFTYRNFGAHLLFVSLLAAIFQFDWYVLWFLVLAAVGLFLYTKAVKEKSFYFLLITTLYCYVAFSYVFIRSLLQIHDIEMGIVYLGLFYFIGSGIALVVFLMHHNKKLKSHDSV